MKVLLGRHALSHANNYEESAVNNPDTTLAYGHPDAVLMNKGILQSIGMGYVFIDDYHVDPRSTPVAVSRMTRSRQTAQFAGFMRRTIYPALDEVDTGYDKDKLKETNAAGINTEVGLRIAEAILADPPEELVWITHGLVIAGITEILGLTDKFENFVPKFCEIREIEI